MNSGSSFGPPMHHTGAECQVRRGRDEATARRFFVHHGITRGGPMDYQIHGALCHHAGPIAALPGQVPIFAQLYFHDPQAAARQRELNCTNLDRGFLQELSTFFYEKSPFVHLYLTARERYQEALQASQQEAFRFVINPQMLPDTEPDGSFTDVYTCHKSRALNPFGLLTNDDVEVFLMMLRPQEAHPPVLCCKGCSANQSRNTTWNLIEIILTGTVTGFTGRCI